MNENQRVQQVLLGNSSAFGYFVEIYQHMAITIAYRVCGNMQDAEDIVQESFVKAYRNLHTFRKDSKFSSWFYRIVYNTAITQTKSQMWIRNSEIDSDNVIHYKDDNFEDKIASEERVLMIEQVLNHMSKGDALLLTLYYLEDNTVKDVAQITGLNESNVKVRLYRARHLFKEIWLSHFQITNV